MEIYITRFGEEKNFLWNETRFRCFWIYHSYLRTNLDDFQIAEGETSVASQKRNFNNLPTDIAQ